MFIENDVDKKKKKKINSGNFNVSFVLVFFFKPGVSNIWSTRGSYMAREIVLKVKIV